MTPRQIHRHHAALRGRLRRRVVRSAALGVRKPYYLYTPPGHGHRGLPLLVLLRGHEREWVNLREDDSRQASTVEDLDRAIAAGALPPMAVLMPGLCSANNHVHSCGINMAGTWPGYARTVGTGAFWTYLTEELYPHVSSQPMLQGGPRWLAGFSLGGYTAHLWGIRHPGAFDHVGIYDGTLMWPRHDDPREPGGAFSDPIWTAAGIFNPALGARERRRPLRAWNPTDTLREAGQSHLQALRTTTFWIASASRDGSAGNRDRARFARRLLADRGVPVGFNTPILNPDAAHTYHWADRFVGRMLRRIVEA